MNNKIIITIAGATGSGKDIIRTIIEQGLNRGVVNRPDLEPARKEAFQKLLDGSIELREETELPV
jgi:hypothetical protein